MYRAALLLLLSAAGCTPDYPMDKEGTWHLPAIGANDANLHTMIVNPHDLVAGSGESTTYGAEAGPPVQRLLTGQRYQLPASNVLQVNLVNPQQSQPPPQGGASVQ
jgi:hypothetical protein